MCESCLRDFPVLDQPYCSLCSLPFLESRPEGHLCGTCLDDPPPFSKAVSLGLYRGSLHDLVWRMKYHQEERIADLLGEWLGERLMKEGLKMDLVLPVPLHPRRLRRRGFNQSAWMARRIADKLGLPVDCRLLHRVKETTFQPGLDRAERIQNMKGAFAVRETGALSETRVLLVDDVYTTGATLLSCIAALKKAGVRDVVAAVAARTP